MIANEHLFWDNHTYVTPYLGTPTIEGLKRHKQAGCDVAFFNLGDADKPFGSTLLTGPCQGNYICRTIPRFKGN